MAAVINKRDAALQAASPRTITVNLGATVNVNGLINGTAANTVVSNANTGATHAGLVGNVHNVSLSQIRGDLDSIANGVTYFRTTANQVTGAGRAFNALDSSNEYIKSLVSTKMTVVGANPATGIAIDANGIRMYQSSALKVNIPVSGAPSFTGDISGGSNINITGTGRFNGATSQAGVNNAIVANNSRNQHNGVLAYDGTATGGVSVGAVSASTNGIGVETSASGSGGKGITASAGSGTGATGVGVEAIAFGSATALSVLGPMKINSTALVSNLNADMVDGLHASSFAKLSGGNTWSGGQFFSNDIDVNGWVQCNNFRIDQNPSTGSATATFPGNNKPGSTTTCQWLTINLNGTTKYIPVWG